jgi:hypothetical protein
VVRVLSAEDRGKGTVHAVVGDGGVSRVQLTTLAAVEEVVVSVASKMTKKSEKKVKKSGRRGGALQLAGSHIGWRSCNCAASLGRARRLKAWVGGDEEEMQSRARDTLQGYYTYNKQSDSNLASPSWRGCDGSKHAGYGDGKEGREGKLGESGSTGCKFIANWFSGEIHSVERIAADLC